MVERGHFQSNQLLFNLRNGSAPATTSTKFQPPKPIIIEKIPIATTPPRGHGPASALPKFTAICAESLSRAVELARRDLRKKNHDSRSSSPARNRQRSGSTRIVQSRSYQDKLKKRQRRVSPVLVVKERQAVKSTKTATVQTQRIASEAPGVRRQHELVDLPARSMSPPTRDQPMTHEDKVLSEICRLRTEMTKCLQQMRSIKERKDRQPKASGKAAVYAEDLEEERRRKIRAEERATRSARTIYMLMQQTSRLYNEVKKLDTKVKLDSKKGPLTSRLAALHRGVVRALQLLVQQMSDDDSLQSVMRDSRDLAIIIRQLSICCAQLEVTNESSVAQDDLLSLLKDVVELNEIVERVQPSSSPLRRCQMAYEDRQRKLPHSMSVAESNAASYRNPVEKVRVTLDEIGENIAKSQASSNAREFKMEASILEQRKAALSSGLRRLLVNDVSSREPVSASAHKVQWKKKKFRVCHSPRSRSRRSLLFTRPSTSSSCGCKQRDSAEPSDVTSNSYQHHAGPTVSMSQKRRAIQNRTSFSPARVRASPSASETSWHFAEPTFSKIQKEVCLSREQSRGSSRSPSPHPTPRRSAIPRSSGAEEDSWRRYMEGEIRAKIEPVLKNGQIAADVNKVTDDVIDDLMTDMASELHRRRTERELGFQAAVLLDAPDVKTILQRLRQMEMEQDEIRQRWTSLAYGETRPRTGFTVTEAPSSPVPIELIAGVKQKNGHLSAKDHAIHIPDSSDPIIFTKPRTKSTIRETDFEVEKSYRSGFVISLQPGELYNIRQQVENYEEFLRRHVNDRVEHFDPWKVVEDIADDILENCLHDVCSELEEINNDIVDHVYRTEFSLVPGKEHQS